MPKSKKQIELEQQVEELTSDLQRTRADFENYRKRVDVEKIAIRDSGKISAIMQLIPVIDTIERAIAHAPADLTDNQWVQGITGLSKNLEKSLDNLGLKRIDAASGVEFNPDLHEAIQFDEDADGEKEIIAEELQAGYILNGQPIRHAMVKVTRQ